MKTFFALLAISSTTFAKASYNFPGFYSEPASTWTYSHDRALCERDGGTWSPAENQEESDLCVYHLANTVKIHFRNRSLDYGVAIQTVGSNGDMCSFEGTGILKGKSLVVKSKVHSACVLDVTFSEANTIEVNNNGKCSDFCGINAWLRVDAAKRVES